MGKPVILDCAEAGVGKFLQYIDAARTLDRKLRVGVAQFFDNAIEVFDVLPHPIDVLLARASVNHQEEIVVAQAMNDNVIDEGALRIEHGGVMGLANGEL